MFSVPSGFQAWPERASAQGTLRFPLASGGAAPQHGPFEANSTFQVALLFVAVLKACLGCVSPRWRPDKVAGADLRRLLVYARATASKLIIRMCICANECVCVCVRVGRNMMGASNTLLATSWSSIDHCLPACRPEHAAHRHVLGQCFSTYLPSVDTSMTMVWV